MDDLMARLRQESATILAEWMDRHPDEKTTLDWVDLPDLLAVVQEHFIDYHTGLVEAAEAEVDEARRQRAEAVRLLRQYPGGEEDALLYEWEQKNRAFLARHKEAQHG